MLGQGAITLLITDGLERDDLDRLEAEMERLAKSSRRVIWVNPLLRFGDFAAKAGGIRAMLPYVEFVPPNSQSRQHGGPLPRVVRRPIPLTIQRRGFCPPILFRAALRSGGRRVHFG